MGTLGIFKYIRLYKGIFSNIGEYLGIYEYIKVYQVYLVIYGQIRVYLGIYIFFGALCCFPELSTSYPVPPPSKKITFLRLDYH